MKSQSLPILILQHIPQNIYRITLTSTHLRHFFAGEEGDLPVGLPTGSILVSVIWLENGYLFGKMTNWPVADFRTCGFPCGFFTSFYCDVTIAQLFDRPFDCDVIIKKVSQHVRCRAFGIVCINQLSDTIKEWYSVVSLKSRLFMKKISLTLTYKPLIYRVGLGQKI